jgi:hypothetical protein
VVWECELIPLPDPHPMNGVKAATMSKAPSTERVFRLRTVSRPSRSSSGSEALEKPARFAVRATIVDTGAVVAAVTVTVCAAPPLNCTEEVDKVQVGAGVVAGATTHPRVTVPENEPTGVSDMLNIALCPALTLWEAVGGPVIAKSGAA